MNVATRGTNEVPSYHGGLENLDEEFDYWIEDVDGTVPADLHGSLLRNGPGRQKIGGAPYGHWFDGDGMLSRFTFVDGRAHFRNRYVRTPKYLRETAQQKILYRGFGTQIPGGWRKNIFRMPTNPANTSVVYHGGHLLALNEGGRPWELQADSLVTLGEFDYAGALKGKTFSAHGKIHPQTGDYINFGTGTTGWGLKPPKPCINVYRINPAGEMINSSQLPIDWFPFCHDYALTERHAVFFINSITFTGMAGFLLGKASLSDLVNFDNSLPMKIMVVDLDTLAVARIFETDPGAIVHFGNAFERDHVITVDGMFQNSFSNDSLANVFNPDAHIGGGAYHRYHLNMNTGTVDCETMSEHEAEFPTFNTAMTGQPHAATYTACSTHNGADSFFNAFQKVTDNEATLVTLPAGTYGSEPLYAPAANSTAEDDGYLLEVVYDGYSHKSELQIYRADNINDRVCTLKLPHHLPHQFHGFFSTTAFGG